MHTVPVTARKPLVVAMARHYVRYRLRRQFDGVFTAGLKATRRLAVDEPLIIAANHVCWWDALSIVALDEALGTKSHCLMDAGNLRKLGFFGWLGAVPLDRTSARSSLADLIDASRLMETPQTALWVFPQGQQQPAHIRPLGLHSGIAWLARRSGVRVVPLALNYLFRESRRPTLLAHFGEPLPAPSAGGNGSRAAIEQLDGALLNGLRRIDDFVVDATGPFVPLIAPQRRHAVPLLGRLLANHATRGEAPPTKTKGDPHV
jgi:1-acyl-sn-glycerol-3-phosphate acyltransferase